MLQARNGGRGPLDFFEGRKYGNTVNSQWKLKYEKYIITVTYKHVCYFISLFFINNSKVLKLHI